MKRCLKILDITPLSIILLKTLFDNTEKTVFHFVCNYTCFNKSSCLNDINVSII